MKILVVGRVGQLGSALSEVLPERYETKFVDQPDIFFVKYQRLAIKLRENLKVKLREKLKKGLLICMKTYNILCT